MKPVCYLDLDGVLVDFHTGAMDLHKRHIPYNTIVWDFWGQLGLTAEQFWQPLGYNFWKDLPWTTEGKKLLTALKTLFGERIVITTSPCWTDGCIQGKMDWLKRELPEMVRTTSMGPAKHLLAGPGKILVDDSDANIKLFTDEGGTAVRVPRPWNVAKSSCLPHGCFDVPTLVREVEYAFTWLSK